MNHVGTTVPGFTFSSTGNAIEIITLHYVTKHTVDDIFGVYIF